MIWLWTGFLALVLVILALDLGVLNRRAHVVSVREAMIFVIATALLASAFTVFVYFGYERHWLGLGTATDQVDGLVNDGRLAAVKFFTGYLIEMSLSMDNVFVIALIFEHLRVPAQYQHRVLFWGILGALVMRGAMIGVGAQLVQRYHWILYVFGVFLLYTAVKMVLAKDDERAPEESGIVRMLARLMPITDQFHGQHFFVRSVAGTLMLTPLAVALVLIEFTDLLFAVDSIPAIFAITADPFLVFTSNVFAILALRSLYFAIAGAMRSFRYLKLSLALILAVVGIKMLFSSWIRGLLGPNANLYLLGLVALLFVGGIVASKLRPLPEDSETVRDASP
jgi:tellurite resistance protein TerC